MPPAQAAPQGIDYVDDVLGVTHWHCVHVILIAGPMRREHMSVLEKGCHALALHYPAGVVGLSIVPRDTPPTPADVRRLGSEAMQRIGPVLLHSHVVMEGDGVWASMVRTMLRGLNMAWRRRPGIQVHHSLEHAYQAILTELPEDLQRRARPADFKRLVDELRGRLRTHAGPVAAHR